MPSDDRSWNRKLEIAHVLFMDIVGYSKLPMEQQPEFLQRLMRVVRGTAEFQASEAVEQLISLPTGDGMALVFFSDAESAPRCAVEVGRALRSEPDLPLRMGLHSGPVYRVADINTQMNVAGGGINLAQRVMDCGDAGHILVSEPAASVLGQLSAWARHLHDLGEVEVKHGTRVRIFNLYGADFGNEELPEKVPRASQPAAPPLRVALIYKRHAEPDERVLNLLEEALRGRGHAVFVDRHVSIGVEWAKKVEARVREADAVVPLLSADSITSELLAYEVQLAHDAAQATGGPRILPVRVNFKGQLPPPLGTILSPVRCFSWGGPEDDETLVGDILNVLSRPEPGGAAPEPVEAREPGGAIPLDAKYYVVRSADEDFASAIRRRESIVLVKGARQMGKTSLLARGLQQARRDGSQVVLTDFQVFNAAQLSSADALFKALARLICDQVGLDVEPDEDWHPLRGASINFARYMRRRVLDRLSTPLVWALDEVDRLFTCEFGSEVFGLFRSWHNERALDPSSPWGRLTLAIVYATEAHLFIKDPNQSPFNVGTRLELRDFTLDQAAELNRRLGGQLKTQQEMARFYDLVGGHPYLLHRGLSELRGRGMTLNTFEPLADHDEGPFGDHLRRILVLLARDPALCDVVRAILRGGRCATTESFYRLRSAGIMSGESAREAAPRCRLYATYLKRHLL